MASRPPSAEHPAAEAPAAHPSDGGFVPWTPPGSPPLARAQDAVRPLAWIACGAVVVALVTAWVAREPTPPAAAAQPLVSVADTRATFEGPATLLVDSDPTGATVWLDGDSVGVTPLWLDAVEPGRITLSVTADGASRDTTLTLRAAQDASVEMQFPIQDRLGEEPTPSAQPIASRPAAASAAPPPADSAPTPSPARAPRRAAETAAAPPAPEARPEDASRSGDGRTGSIEITSSPSGAAVWFQKRKRGVTPMTLEQVPTGEQFVELRVQGYEPEILRLDVRPGNLVAETIALRTRPGLVTVVANAASQVYVDGQIAGATGGDPLQLALAPGTHEVRVRTADGGEETRRVDVVPGTTLRLVFEIEPPETEDEGRRGGW